MGHPSPHVNQQVLGLAESTSPWGRWARSVMEKENKRQETRWALVWVGYERGWGSATAALTAARGCFCLATVGFVPFLPRKLYLGSKYIKQMKEEFQWLIGPHTDALEVPFQRSISHLSAEPLWVPEMPLDLKALV